MARFHLLAVGLATLLALPSVAQRGRVFAYGSNETVAANEAYAAAQKKKKPQSVGTQVYVVGNFGATFSVHGPGSNNSGRQDELISITTNEPLTFQASGFTTLMTGGGSASSVGSIQYDMQLYYGTATSVGAAITADVSGTDTGFDGGQLVLTNSEVPGNGQVVLRLSRTLTLNQLAEGATTYTASGTIVLTIN
jgi:hypothetical protein